MVLPPLAEGRVAARGALAPKLSKPLPTTLLLRSDVHLAKVIHSSFCAELRLLVCVDSSRVVSIVDIAEGRCLNTREFDEEHVPQICEFAQVAVGAPGARSDAQGSSRFSHTVAAAVTASITGLGIGAEALQSR